jgi:hypothetical protein
MQAFFGKKFSKKIEKLKEWTKEERNKNRKQKTTTKSWFAYSGGGDRTLDLPGMNRTL